MLKRLQHQGSGPWYKRVGNQIGIIVAVVGTAVVFITNLNTIKTGIASLWGGGIIDPKLTVDDKPYVSTAVEDPYLGYISIPDWDAASHPNTLPLNMVTTTIRKNPGIRLTGCRVSVRNPMAHWSYQTEIGTLGKSLTAKEISFFTVISPEEKLVMFSVACDGAESNTVQFKLVEFRDPQQ